MNRIEIWDSFVSLFILPFFSVLPERGDMEMTIGMRIRECRLALGMTQEELADVLQMKKITLSAYENDRIDLKVSILKEIAVGLGTTVAYLIDGEENEFGLEVMQVARLLQGIENEQLRKAAMEQVKVLAAYERRSN